MVRCHQNMWHNASANISTSSLADPLPFQEVALQAEKAEQELQQKIKRENAELAKAANIREETMRSLTVQRARTQEERKMLAAIKRVSPG